MTISLTYAKRHGALDARPRVWKLEAEKLVEVDPNGHTKAAELRDVIRLRIQSGIGQGRPFAGLCIVEAKATAFTINDMDATAVGEYDISASYGSFVRALLSQLKVLAPTTRVRLGRSLSSATVDIGVAVSLTLIGVAGLFGLMTGDVGLDAIVSAFCLVLGPPLLWRGIQDWPRVVSVFDVPPDAIPE